MARWDKVWVAVRAPAGTALTGNVAVTINSGGSVVPSGSATAVGVICVPGTIPAGDKVAVVTKGEIVEFGGSAGASLYAAGASGSISTTTGGTKLGWTVEADRFVVSM